MLPTLPCPIRDPFDRAAAEAAQAVRTLSRDCAIAVIASRHLRSIGADWCVRSVDAALARRARSCDRYEAEQARTLPIPCPSHLVARRDAIRSRLGVPHA